MEAVTAKELDPGVATPGDVAPEDRKIPDHKAKDLQALQEAHKRARDAAGLAAEEEASAALVFRLAKRRLLAAEGLSPSDGWDVELKDGKARFKKLEGQPQG